MGGRAGAPGAGGDAQAAQRQFKLLLSKANEKFAKLRELESLPFSVAEPRYRKLFSAFSTLWQFQLTNR